MGKGQKMFYREKKTDCGLYREVDVIPRTDNAERAVRVKEGKEEKQQSQNKRT